MSACVQNAHLNLPAEIYQEVLGEFIRGQDEVLCILEENHAKLQRSGTIDQQHLERVAHQRKGEAGMMGLYPFQRLYERLQERAHQKTLGAADLDAIITWLRPAVAGLHDLSRPVTSSEALLTRLR